MPAASYAQEDCWPVRPSQRMGCLVASSQGRARRLLAGAGMQLSSSTARGQLSSSTARGCLVASSQWRARAAASGVLSTRQAAALAATCFRNQAATKADIDLLVGSVYETDAQHLKRHAGFMRNCIRCLEITARAHIARIAPWASARPSHLGGGWRLGCRICAAGRKSPAARARQASHMAMNKNRSVCKQAILRCSTWASFQYVGRTCSYCRLSVLIDNIKKHATSDFHRLSADV